MLLKEILNKLLTQVILCLIFLSYIKYISNTYNIILHFGTLNINIYFVIIIAILVLLIAEFRRYFKYDNNEFYYFIYWMIIITSSIIFLTSYFDAKENYDFVCQSKFFSIKLDYVLQAKIDYLHKLLNNMLLYSNILDNNKKIVKHLIINNDTLLLAIETFNMENVRIICQTQIVIANMVYENTALLNQIYEENIWKNTKFYQIFILIKNSLFLMAISTFCFHKLPSIILLYILKKNLILLVKHEIIAQNVEFNMTETEILDFCLLIAEIIIKSYHPLIILKELLIP